MVVSIRYYFYNMIKFSFNTLIFDRTSIKTSTFCAVFGLRWLHCSFIAQHECWKMIKRTVNFAVLSFSAWKEVPLAFSDKFHTVLQFLIGENY